MWVYQRLTFDFVFLLGIDVWQGWTCSIMINLLVELWNRSSDTLDQLLFLARCCETRRSTRLHGEQCLAQISTTTVLPQSYCLERSACHDHVPMAWNIHGKNGTFPRKLVEWLDLMNWVDVILPLFWSDLIQSVLSNLISSNLRGSRDLRPRTGPWEPRAFSASGSCHVWGTDQKRVFVQEGTGQLGMEGHQNSGFLDHVLWHPHNGCRSLSWSICAFWAQHIFGLTWFRTVWKMRKGVPRSSDTWISSVQTYLPFVAHWTTTTLWLRVKPGEPNITKETSHLHPELKLILGTCWRLLFEGVLFRDAPDIDSTMLKQHSDVWRTQDLSWSQKDLFDSPKPINLFSSRFEIWDDFFLGRQA